jgi:integrase
MGKWSGPNPVADTKKRKLPKKVPDYLRPEEVGPVLAALPDRWRSLFATAIYTGMRKGELLGLRKSDVDLERRLVTVARSYDRATTKGGHADVLPIAAELIPYLEAAIESSPSDLVFPKPDGTMACETLSLEIVPRRAFRRAGIVASYRHSCRRQGCGHREGAPDATLRRCPKCNMKLWPHGLVRPIRFHHLRHTTASLLMMAGANPAAVQRIMRHTDPRLTTEVYGHLAPGYLRSEIDRLQLAPPPPESPRVAVAIETTPASATAPGLAADLLQTGPFQASGGSEVIAQALVVATKKRVGARGFEPPTFCSQKRRTRSQALAAACNRKIFTIRIGRRPAVRRTWEQIRRILLLFCSRNGPFPPETGMWGFHVAPCSLSPTSRAGSASPRRPFTSCAREELSHTSAS